MYPAREELDAEVCTAGPIKRALDLLFTAPSLGPHDGILLVIDPP